MENSDQVTKPVSIYSQNRALLIGAILIIIIGLVSDVYWFRENPANFVYLLNLLPGSSLLLTWYLSSKHSKRRWLFIILGSIITIIITAIVYLLNVAGWVVVSATTPIEDSSQYGDIVNQIGESVLINHFPDSIPSNASNIKFYYFGGFMQAGASIQLRYKLPKDEIIELNHHFQSIAKYEIQDGGKSYDESIIDAVPLPSFLTSGTDAYKFPENYRILIIAAEPLGSQDFMWNHGYSYGVVISVEESEVIYWADDW